MFDHLLASALATFYARAWWRAELRDYLLENKIELGAVLPFVGAIALLDVVEFADDRFDFRGPGELIACLVFEALDADERPYDLVALPIGQPDRPMTLRGKVGLLNRDLALWPGSYSMGKTMPVFRNARDWMASGCRGAAVIRPDVAARQLLDVPGELVPRDPIHAQELRRILNSVVRRRIFAIPAAAKSVA